MIIISVVDQLINRTKPTVQNSRNKLGTFNNGNGYFISLCPFCFGPTSFHPNIRTLELACFQKLAKDPVPFAIILNMAEGFKLYHYNPSAGAAVAFAAVFGLTTVIHIWQLGRSRAWYFIPFLIGCFCESIHVLIFSSVMLTMSTCQLRRLDIWRDMLVPRKHRTGPQNHILHRVLCYFWPPHSLPPLSI